MVLGITLLVCNLYLRPVVLKVIPFVHNLHLQPQQTFDLDDNSSLRMSSMTITQLFSYSKQRLHIDNNWQLLTQIII